VPLGIGASAAGDFAGSEVGSGLGYVWCGYVHECGPPPSWWAGAWRFASFAHIGFGAAESIFGAASRQIAAQSAGEALGALDAMQEFETCGGGCGFDDGASAYGFLTVERYSNAFVLTWWVDAETDPITGNMLYFNQFCGSMRCENPGEPQ
jgi:hypothetical protein